MTVFGNRVFKEVIRAPQVALVVNNLPANAGDIGDAGLISGSGRSPGGGHGNSLQYSCLEKPMDRGAWHIREHSVAKSQTQLKRLSKHTRITIFRIPFLPLKILDVNHLIRTSISSNCYKYPQFSSG